ncbi:hypothetical protein BH11GEM1_BH11GEM1_10850 [soil metagenome]
MSTPGPSKAASRWNGGAAQDIECVAEREIAFVQKPEQADVAIVRLYLAGLNDGGRLVENTLTISREGGRLHGTKVFPVSLRKSM